MRKRFLAAVGVSLLALSAAADAVLAINDLPAAPPITNPTEVHSGGVSRADGLYFHRNLQRGNLDQSTALLQTMVAANSGDAAALWRLGRNWVEAGSLQSATPDKLKFYDLAEQALRRSLQINGNQADAHYWLGVEIGQRANLSMNLSAVSQIRGEMAATLRINPGYGSAHFILGEILFEAPWPIGNNKNAIKEFELAVQLSPNDTKIYPALAAVYVKEGRKDQAKTLLAKFADIKTPDDPAVYSDDLSSVQNLLQQLK